MVQIPEHDLSPFPLVVLYGLRVSKVKPPVRELGPRQVSQAISPVVEAFLKDLLVQPGPVEPEGLGTLDVSL